MLPCSLVGCPCTRKIILRCTPRCGGPLLAVAGPLLTGTRNEEGEDGGGETWTSRTCFDRAPNKGIGGEMMGLDCIWSQHGLGLDGLSPNIGPGEK